MDNIFGIPMTTILIVVLTIMGICLLTTAIIAWRNPVIFKMAVRNVPRRKAQTVLIMVGLMLATLIIAASLTTGDTIDYSITSSTYRGLGQTDETIAFVGDTEGEGDISVNNVPIPASIADVLEARFAADPDIEAVMPILTASVPVVNLDERLSEPSVILTGVDTNRLDEFGGLVTPDDQPIDFSAATAGSTPLPPDLIEQVGQLGDLQAMGVQVDDLSSLSIQPVVISEDLADEISADIGDLLVFFHGNTPYPVTVAEIARGSILTGFTTSFEQGANMLGIAMPLEEVQEITGLEGQARFIAVSNAGGVEQGAGLTDDVMPKLEAALAEIEGGDQLGVNPIKQDAIEGAETFGNIFMSFFIVLGLFSVAAGVLLIFLIFMMLAAERRSEMGMARAVGMKRSHLIQSFIAEGTIYDLGAALIGAAAGVGVAFAIAGVMASLIGEFIAITPHATWRSLLVAYALGVSVTFLTIIFASVRSSRLNIVAAIRDLPEDAHASRPSRPRWRWWRSLPRFGPRAGIYLISLIWFPVEVLWNVVLLPLRFVIWLLRLIAHYVGWGVHLTAIGVFFLLTGVGSESIFLFSVGLTFAAIGLALFLKRYLPSRPVYTFFAALMLAFWLLPQDALAAILPDLGTGGFEMFFVSGLSMVTFATLIIMWNAEVIVAIISAIGRVFSRWLPAVKTAVAYPLAAKGRTGLTVAMFSMVIFSLVTLTTINANFVELFSTDEADAGWDISVATNPSNPIDDLRAELAGSDVDIDAIGAVGQIESIAYGNSQIRNAGEEEWKRIGINGMSDDYVANAEVPLQARAPGYESDEAVWDAIRSGESVAVIDSFPFSDDGFGNDPEGYMAPTEVAIQDGVIQPFEIEVQSARTGTTETLTVVGVIDSKVSTLFGLYTGEEQFDEVFGDPDFTALYVQLTPEAQANVEEFARDIEAALLTSGAQAVAIQEQIEEQQAVQNGFFKLLQGFMGLGLLVGIAALGVISFRSVVERRQQIGMLRAIGYQRNMVALSFLLESLVIAALGVLSGTILAVILSYNLINADDFSEGQDFTGFVIPWTTIVMFIVASLAAAALMTWVPAKKASSVPIAEALRYE